MRTLDINALDLVELKQLQKDVAKAIESFESRKKADAVAALEAQAKELGFSLADLAGAAKGKKRGISAPKYRHPENPNITWTGRGRKPRWVSEHIASGKDIEELEI
ncbi:H-NS family nucleoid-associated regulatory protein [Solirhodobacter olei]|uniref:H-NS histone family protein n=1 Tax=Solirhodobacter olei TaxID=2493082 RepID=UPI000FDC7E8D|nr:H-NS histone family protein [Solirhodobacter olei]